MARRGGAGAGGEAVLILALARGLSQREASDETGIPVRTVERRWSRPEFRREVERVRADLLSRAVGRMADAAVEAVKVLRELLSDENRWLRESAARDLLAAMIRLREHATLEDRIARLEERVAVEDSTDE